MLDGAIRGESGCFLRADEQNWDAPADLVTERRERPDPRGVAGFLGLT